MYNLNERKKNQKMTISLAPPCPHHPPPPPLLSPLSIKTKELKWIVISTTSNNFTMALLTRSPLSFSPIALLHWRPYNWRPYNWNRTRQRWWMTDNWTNWTRPRGGLCYTFVVILYVKIFTLSIYKRESKYFFSRKRGGGGGVVDLFLSTCF